MLPPPSLLHNPAQNERTQPTLNCWQAAPRRHEGERPAVGAEPPHALLQRQAAAARSCGGHHSGKWGTVCVHACVLACEWVCVRISVNKARASCVAGVCSMCKWVCLIVRTCVCTLCASEPGIAWLPSFHQRMGCHHRSLLGSITCAACRACTQCSRCTTGCAQRRAAPSLCGGACRCQGACMILRHDSTLVCEAYLLETP